MGSPHSAGSASSQSVRHSHGTSESKLSTSVQSRKLRPPQTTMNLLTEKLPICLIECVQSPQLHYLQVIVTTHLFCRDQIPVTFQKDRLKIRNEAQTRFRQLTSLLSMRYALHPRKPSKNFRAREVWTILLLFTLRTHLRKSLGKISQRSKSKLKALPPQSVLPLDNIEEWCRMAKPQCFHPRLNRNQGVVNQSTCSMETLHAIS